jgi:hypothetical protein
MFTDHVLSLSKVLSQYQSTLVGAMGSGAESGTSITQASVPILTQPYVKRDYSSGQEVVDARRSNLARHLRTLRR